MIDIKYSSEGNYVTIEFKKGIAYGDFLKLRRFAKKQLPIDKQEDFFLLTDELEFEINKKYLIPI